MTDPVVIDAGPAINFLATGNERLLLSVVGGKVWAPETVEDEVKRKGARDPRFSAVPGIWNKLYSVQRITILKDDVTAELSTATQRITGIPLADRKSQAQDLGETMVVAHAAVKAEEGADVTVLIDDGGGARLATREIRRLDRLRPSRPDLGSIRLVSTLAVLEDAAGSHFIPDRGAMRRIYTDIAACDDGLVDITQTGLLAKSLWTQ